MATPVQCADPIPRGGEVVEPSLEERLIDAETHDGHADAFFRRSPHAGPKHIRYIVTAAPRALGRTVENMVTFKDPGLAVTQWVLMGAVLFDAKTSLDLTRRCPDPCENYGPVWGAHPPAARV